MKDSTASSRQEVEQLQQKVEQVAHMHKLFVTRTKFVSKAFEQHCVHL